MAPVSDLVFVPRREAIEDFKQRGGVIKVAFKSIPLASM